MFFKILNHHGFLCPNKKMIFIFIQNYFSVSENGKTKKRKKSTEKERQRNLEIKAALSTLSKSMPYVNKELSRIRTLRLAREYIKHLKRILQGEMVRFL